MIAKLTPDHADRSLLDYYETIYRPLKVGGISEKNAYQYRMVIRQFGEHLKHAAKLSDLTDENVAAFIAAIVAKGRRPGTANKARNHLLAIWRFAATKRHVEEGPVVGKMRDHRYSPTAWTAEQMARIVDVCSTGRWSRTGKVGNIPSNLYWTALILTLYDTGLRIGAALELTAKDIDLTTGRVTVRPETQKQRAQQVLDISEQTRKVLARLLGYTSGKLFEWPLHQASFYNQYSRILAAAGLSSGRRDKFHRIRRTAATLAELHVGPGTASRLLGHSSPEVTEGYIDRSLFPENRIADKLPRMPDNALPIDSIEQLPTAPVAQFADEYIATVLEAFSVSKRGSDMSASRLRFMLGACRIATIADISGERILGWLDECRASGRAEKSLADYRQAMARFVRWLMVTKRLSFMLADTFTAISIGKGRRSG